MTTNSDNRPKKNISFAALVSAVATALFVGALVSLAIRPPGSGPAESQASDESQGYEQLHWRVPLAFGTNLPVVGELETNLAKLLKDATDGAIVLELYEPGELTPPFSITEGIKNRKFQAGITWAGYDQGRIPASTLISSVPFGMEPVEFIAWWYEGGGEAMGQAVYHEHNTQLLLCGVTGPETAGWFRKPIRSVEDFKGLKIRFAGLGGKVMQRLGASVTMMPGGEIFQALEKGAIDATEFSLPAIDQQLGFDRVAKFNYFPGWHQTFTSNQLLVNKEVWDELREDTRSLFRTACRANVTYSLGRSEMLQGGVLKGFGAKGVSAETLPLDVLRKLHQVTLEVLDEEASKDAWFDQILTSQRAFSETYGIWARTGYLPRDFK